MSRRFTVQGMGHRGPALLVATTLVLLLAGLASPSGAVTVTWSNPTGGSWSNPANWSPAVVPDAVDVTAVLPALAGPYQVTLDRSPALLALEVDAGGPTLDLASYSIASVSDVTNAGTILNFRGLYDSSRLHNLASGTVRVAGGDVMQIPSVLAGRYTRGVLSNDGTIILGPSSTLLVTSYRDSLAGTGKLVLDGALISSPAGLPHGPGPYQISIGSACTLTGSGDVWVDTYNFGLLEADGASSTLGIKGHLENYATIRVSDGGTINHQWAGTDNFNGVIAGHGGTFTDIGTVNFLDGGTLVADGGDLTISCLALLEATVERSGGSGAVHILMATPQDLVVTPGSEVVVDGQFDNPAGTAIFNDGTVRLRGLMNLGGGTSTISLAGSGTLVLDGGTLAGQVINTAGHTITGCGTISASMTNYGVIDASCGEMTLSGMDKINRGVIRTSTGRLKAMGPVQVKNVAGGSITLNGGQFWIQDGPTLDLSGGPLVSNGSLVWFRRGACTISGGRLEGTGAAQFSNQGSVTLKDVTLGPGAVYYTDARSSTQATGTSFTVQGVNQVASMGTFTVAPTTDYIQTGGATELLGGQLSATRELQIQGGALRGTGTVVANVANADVVGSSSASERLTIQGNYRQLPTGRLNVALAGSDAGQVGGLDVTGGTTLDGTLAVAAVGGFTPSTGSVFQVMSYQGLSGHFAELQVANELTMVPQYDQFALVLQADPAPVSADNPPMLPTELRFRGLSGVHGVSFALELPAAAEVTIRAYDVSGRVIAKLADGSRPAGRYDFGLCSRDLASGVYFARADVRAGGHTDVRTARVVFVK
jgi:filamentous hemagglutinin